MSRSVLRFLRGNTIALLALFVALGGTTYAATALPKNSVGTKQLRKNAVTGVKVKNNSLTGADIVESSLGTVPSATHASTADSATNATHATSATSATNATNAANAANAAALGGLGPNGYQKIPTSPQHYSMSSLQYVDEDSGSRTRLINLTVGWCSNGGAGRLDGAVNLPQGVTVTGIKLDYIDDSGVTTSNGDAYLTRMPLLGGGGTYVDIFHANLPNTASAGALASATGTTASVAGANVIDNTKYNYTLIIQNLSTNAYACGADITYTVPSGFAAAAPVHGAKPQRGSPSRPSTSR